MNDVDLFFAAVLGVEVVPLEFGLDGQSARKAVEALAFVFIVLESLADIADGPVGYESCYHSGYCFLRMRILEYGHEGSPVEGSVKAKSERPL